MSDYPERWPSWNARRSAVERTPYEKFLRDVEREQYGRDHHRTRARYSADGWRAACSCSWVGPLRSSGAEATRDGLGHFADVERREGTGE